MARPHGDSPPLAAPRPLRAGDYGRAREVVDDWFGHPVGLVMHRLFFDQLGPSGVWIEDAAGRPVGFLLGLVSEAEPGLAYVHMHAVDPAWRGRGVGEALYRDFARRAAGRGCRRIRALVGPGREASRRFHERLGFVATWCPGYLGPGADRHVCERALPLDEPQGWDRAPRILSTRTTSQDGPMSTEEPQDERRAHPRRDVELPVRVSVDDEVVEGVSVNLSEGGALMAGDDFPSASQVRVEIELAELGWHAIDAEVVRRGTDDEGRESLAVRFAEAATQGGREAIRGFFRSRLGGEP